MIHQSKVRRPKPRSFYCSKNSDSIFTNFKLQGSWKRSWRISFCNLMLSSKPKLSSLIRKSWSFLWESILFRVNHSKRLRKRHHRRSLREHLSKELTNLIMNFAGITTSNKFSTLSSSRPTHCLECLRFRKWTTVKWLVKRLSSQLKKFCLP